MDLTKIFGSKKSRAISPTSSYIVRDSDVELRLNAVARLISYLRSESIQDDLAKKGILKEEIQSVIDKLLSERGNIKRIFHDLEYRISRSTVSAIFSANLIADENEGIPQQAASRATTLIKMTQGSDTLSRSGLNWCIRNATPEVNKVAFSVKWDGSDEELGELTTTVRTEDKQGNILSVATDRLPELVELVRRLAYTGEMPNNIEMILELRAVEVSNPSIKTYNVLNPVTNIMEKKTVTTYRHVKGDIASRCEIVRRNGAKSTLTQTAFERMILTKEYPKLIALATSYDSLTFTATSVLRSLKGDLNDNVDIWSLIAELKEDIAINVESVSGSPTMPEPTTETSTNTSGETTNSNANDAGTETPVNDAEPEATTDGVDAGVTNGDPVN